MDASGQGNNAQQSSSESQPIYRSASFNGLPSVVFDGINDFLQGILSLPEEKTILAAFKDTGSSTNCCSGMFFTNGDNGLETVNVSGQVHLMIDWAGSSDYGVSIVTNQITVASVTYNETTATLYHFSCVDSQVGQSVGATSASYMVGSRGDDQVHTGRFFKGEISEIIVYNRSLTNAERESVEQYLEQQVCFDVNCRSEMTMIQIIIQNYFAHLLNYYCVLVEHSRPQPKLHIRIRLQYHGPLRRSAGEYELFCGSAIIE